MYGVGGFTIYVAIFHKILLSFSYKSYREPEDDLI